MKIKKQFLPYFKERRHGRRNFSTDEDKSQEQIKKFFKIYKKITKPFTDLFYRLPLAVHRLVKPLAAILNYVFYVKKK